MASCLPQHPLRLLNALLHPYQEQHRIPSVHQPVIVGQRQVNHGANHDLIIDRDRPLLDGGVGEGSDPFPDSLQFAPSWQKSHRRRNSKSLAVHVLQPIPGWPIFPWPTVAQKRLFSSGKWLPCRNY